MAGEALHEERTILGAEILDRHRAISTLMEELEAIDWYDQRIQASADDELRATLLHNRNDETEHASMLLEWLRRHDAVFDQQLTKYLFTTGPLRDASGRSTAAVNKPGPETTVPATTGRAMIAPGRATTGPATTAPASTVRATNSLAIGSLRETLQVRSGTE